MDRPFVAYNAIEKMPCAFYTLVIRNTAITERFDGGLSIFLSKYRAHCNREIAVGCSMADDETLEVIDELVKCGLKPEEDFIIFDTARYEIARAAGSPNGFIEDTCEIDLRVDWLKAELSPRGFFVWFVHDTAAPKKGDQPL
jgi:hypothetical protein